MSVKINKVTCYSCGHSFTVPYSETVNSTLAVETTPKIITGDFFKKICPNCGATCLLAYDFLYNDPLHRAMIWVIHHSQVDYNKKIKNVRNSNHPTPPWISRIVADFHELSEKVFCIETNKDDRIIELCKAFLKTQLLEQHPNFTPVRSMYMHSEGKDIVVFYNNEGKNLTCDFPPNLYKTISDLAAKPLKRIPSSYFGIFDAEWADNFLLTELIAEDDSAKKSDQIPPSDESNINKESNKESNDQNASIQQEPNRGSFCRKCGHKLVEGSRFCEKCGTEVLYSTKPALNSSALSEKNINNFEKTSGEKKQKLLSEKVLICIIFSVTAILLAFIIFVFPSSRTNAQITPAPAPTPIHTSMPKPSPTPQSLPYTGQIFKGANLERDSILTVHSATSSSCFIKLKNAYHEDIFSFFVRAGDSIDMSVPSGKFYVYFAYGDDWYGVSDCFGDNTVYSKDDELLDFYLYSWEYTLYPVANGNFSETNIDESEF